MMDSSKPLTILSHVGGSPLLLFASRSKQNIQDYEEAVAWLKKTAVHVEKIAEEKSEPEDWAKYQEIRKRAIVLLERLDKANREHLYPALADGQGAFVLDVEAKSKQWFKQDARVAEAAADVRAGIRRRGERRGAAAARRGDVHRCWPSRRTN